MLRRCVCILYRGEFLSGFSRLKLHTNASKVLYSSFDKDLPNPHLPTPVSKVFSHDKDILLEQITKCKSVDRLLEVSSMHIDVMNAKHIVACMEVIHEINKDENSTSQNLMEHRTFQVMCSKLMKIIRLLDSQEIITVYKALSGLGIRSNTYVMQSVLKMIGGHLNDMNLGQLTFLNFLLSRQRHNSLVDGLRLALPLVLQVQIEQQLDSDNITEVVDCLQLACRSKLKPVTIQKILTAILKKATFLSPTNATTVIFALLNLETPVDGYKELINYSFDVVSKNIELMDQRSILSILRLCHSQIFYHGPFFFAIGDKVVTDKWNLENTWEVIRHFYRLRFCPPMLMDHLVDVICSESKTFRSSSNYTLLNTVEYLTATGYIPSNVHEALNIVCTCEEKLLAIREKTPYLLVKFVGCLAMLGYFPRELLYEVMNEQYLFAAWSRSRKQGRTLTFEYYILSLVWSLDVYDQKNNYPFPVAVLKNLVGLVCQRHSESEYSLEKFIQNGLGGPQFLKSSVFTSDGLLINHMLAMRSGNYPVSLDPFYSSNSETLPNLTFAEDFVLPTDAKIVAVIVAHEDQYCRDPEVLRGWMDIKMKCLAKRNYNPVVINYTTWCNLPDREKIPYLMQEIKQTVQEDHLAKTNLI